MMGDKIKVHENEKVIFCLGTRASSSNLQLQREATMEPTRYTVQEAIDHVLAGEYTEGDAQVKENILRIMMSRKTFGFRRGWNAYLNGKMVDPKESLADYVEIVKGSMDSQDNKVLISLEVGQPNGGGYSARLEERI